MASDGRKTRGPIRGALLLVLALVAGVTAAEGAPAGRGARPPLAYQGAPPLVPHDVEERKGVCQDCHTTGEAGAPITPHPTRTHFCIQCHVGQDPAVGPFVKPAGRR